MRLEVRARKRHEQKGQVAAIRQGLGDRSIVLIGLMGAGKSAIGRRLSVRLDLPFSDADGEIELAAGMTISDIFAVHGEAHFRDGERKVIQRLLMGAPKVLATGGGAYMDPQTRANVKKSAISVWLRADVDILLGRVRRRGNRPLLRHGDPKVIMRNLMEERYPVYSQADITVRSRDVAHDVIVGEILTALSKCPLVTEPASETVARRNGDGTG